VLAAIVAIGAWSIAGGIGFYSDDWAFLAALRHAPDQSFVGLYRALAIQPNLAVRPVQIALYAVWHELAPGDPTLPHLTTQIVFALAIVWVYFAVRAVPVLRRAAFPLALLLACMPHYATARLWYANAMAAPALLGFAAALHMTALAHRARGARFAMAAAGAALAMLFSALAYELFVFVIIASPALVWRLGGRPLARLPRDPRWRALTLALIGVLAPLTVFKLAVAHETLPLRHPLAIAWLTVSSYAQAAWTDFWTLGIYLPRVAAGMAFGPWRTREAAVAAALVVGLLAVRWVVWRRSPSDPDEARAPPRFLFFAGCAAVVLGYVPFLVNFSWGFSPLGIDNRDNIGAAPGIALIGWSVLAAVGARRPRLASALLALWCALGVFVFVAVGQTWVAGWRVQQRLYARVLEAVGRPRPGDIIVLYGACPYRGAAPVFTSSGDLRDRLRYSTGVPDVDAVAVMNGAELRPQGLALTEYGYTQVFPWRRMTMVDARTGETTAIGSFARARVWFAAHPLSAATGCRYRDGDGTPPY
jgi:hypothetical protein